MKKTVNSYDLNNKVVIIRCDLNVPIKNNIIQDDTRIKASLKTINYCLDNGAKVVILSHLGKVKTKDDLKSKSLYPVSIRLAELLNKDVIFSYDTRSDKLTQMVKNLKIGEVLLVENTRFQDLDGMKESNCDLDLASYWASLGDIFINDAYGTCHRCHASNVGISKYLPSGLGFLVSEEVEKINNIMNDKASPFVVIMGGAKVSDKIGVIEKLITQCDKLLIGGGMAYTFLKALGYNIGNSLVDVERLEFCNKILADYGDKIVLPVDSIVSTSIDSKDCSCKRIDKFNDNDIGLDIGDETIKMFYENLKGAKRVIMNGPMGLFENELYEKGTESILKYLKENNIKTLIGGGDTVSCINKLGFENSFYHVSTGGGATLEYFEGKVLPGIEAISDE